ncbi:MAG: DUF1190 domain-containing protein [Brevundimonas sp.]|nr:MAG: DUF1190 domain-containing protein [Brevundimonas sp.]
MSAKIRRRSAAISLSAVVLSGGVAACQPQAVEQKMKVYASADECASSGENWNTCNTTAKAAEAEHLRTAPQFASQDDCIRETGEACREHATGTGGHIFLPLMAGFMMGQMMNRGYVGHPLYHGRDGGFYSGNTRVWDPPPRQDDRQGGGGGGGAGGAYARQTPREISAPLDAKGEVARPGAARRGGFGRTSGFRGAGE